MTKTEAVICYLLAKAAPDAIHKTTLIKLAYMADVESTRRFGVSITGEHYERDRYGAVAYNIPNTARKISGVCVDDHPTHTGNHGTDFSAGPGLPDPEYDLTIHEKVVLDDIYRKYGSQYARDLGDATKRTKPWKQAVESGSVSLDLSVVAPSDPQAYCQKVLSRVDRSTRGTPAQIAKRDAEVAGYMRCYRSKASGGR